MSGVALLAAPAWAQTGPPVPISQLPSAGAPTSSDLFYLVQGGVSKSVTFSGIEAALTGAFLPLTGGTLTGPLAITSTLNVQSNPTLAVGPTPMSFFAATKTVNTAGVALDGIQVQVTDTAGWSGSGAAGINFIEAIRTGAILNNNSALGSAYGGVFVSQDQSATSHTFLVGSEHEILNYTETSVPTNVLNCSSSCTLAISVLGDSDGTQLADAIFAVNPFAGKSLAQSGFLAAGNGLAYAAFADVSTTANFGLDMAYATHAVGAIHIKNNKSIVFNSTVHAQYFGLFLNPTNNLIIGQGTAGVTINNTLNVAGLPTSAGSGGLVVCVDTSGNLYKKSSCP